MKVKDQLHTDDYSLYCGDCMDVLPTLDGDSIDLVIYSPPFAGLYNYSSSVKDFSNCESKEQFMDQYEFLISEMARVTKPGRINAVHCQDILIQTTKHNLWDFPHEIIKLHLKYGFTYNNRITIWKEPLEVRMRTMVQSLMHKNIVEDSTKCFTAIPDYILLFRMGGENKVPVTHENGMNYYAGDTPILKNILQAYNNAQETNYTADEFWKYLNVKFKNHKDHKSNKLSHYIWQRYASSVWDDIRGNNVLQFKDAREEDDEKHVHPLQLDVIDRVVELYSNPGEVILTPFAGVGSEVYSPVSMGRRAIGVELKDSYYKQMVLNMKDVKARFKNEADNQSTLF